MKTYSDHMTEMHAQRALFAIPLREGVFGLCRTFFDRLGQNSRILVIGSETGKLIFQLAEDHPWTTLVGIEPATALMDCCERNVDIRGLNDRIRLEPVSIEEFSETESFDAVAVMLTYRRLLSNGSMENFFPRVCSFLKPGGLLFNVDAHEASHKDRDFMIELWCEEAMIAGVDLFDLEETINNLLKIDRKYLSRDVMQYYIENAGFDDVNTPILSQHYTAWTARKSGIYLDHQTQSSHHSRLNESTP